MAVGLGEGPGSAWALQGASGRPRLLQTNVVQAASQDAATGALRAGEDEDSKQGGWAPPPGDKPTGTASGRGWREVPRTTTLPSSGGHEQRVTAVLVLLDKRVPISGNDSKLTVDFAAKPTSRLVTRYQPQAVPLCPPQDTNRPQTRSDALTSRELVTHDSSRI